MIIIRMNQCVKGLIVRCRQGGPPHEIPSCSSALEFYCTRTCLLCNDESVRLLCCATLLALWWYFFLVGGKENKQKCKVKFKDAPRNPNHPRLYWSECRVLQGRYYHQMNGDAGLGWWCWWRLESRAGEAEEGRRSSDSSSGEALWFESSAIKLQRSSPVGKAGMR